MVTVSIISRGVDLPFVLVLLGVLGGAIAFGFIGIFLGPVLLAVGYALLMEWAASRGRVELVMPADAERNDAPRGVIERIGTDARETASRLRD